MIIIINPKIWDDYIDLQRSLFKLLKLFLAIPSNNVKCNKKCRDVINSLQKIMRRKASKLK